MPATTGQILGKAHKLCEWLGTVDTLWFGSFEVIGADVAKVIAQSTKLHVGAIENMIRPQTRHPLNSIPLRLPAHTTLIECDFSGKNSDGVYLTSSLFLLCRDSNNCEIDVFVFQQQQHRFSLLGGGRLFNKCGENLFSCFAGPKIDNYDYSERVHYYSYIVECTLMALHCTNVRTVDVLPPPALNKKRQQQGKLPLFTFKTLHVLAGERSDSHDKRADDAEAKRSPRLHFRRGHIRRISGDRMTWVQPCMVGDQRSGMVKKAYALVPQNKANKEGTKP